MNVLKNVWKDIQRGRNLDIYITIAISITVVILDILGITDLSVVTSAILATLALVSGSLLRNRQEDEKIRQSLSAISSAASFNLLQHEFDVKKHIDLISNAQKVLIFGSGHTVLIPNLRDYHFSSGLPKDLEMKILLMDPIGNANKIAEFRAGKPLSTLYKENLSTLAELAQSVPDNRLQYQVIDYLPPYNIIAIDPHLPTGVMYVRLSAWRAPTHERPFIWATNENDAESYKYFVKQFEIMWENAKSWSP